MVFVMRRVTHILGNICSGQWAARAARSRLCYIELDERTAQKSRFTALDEEGGEWCFSLERSALLQDGDVVEWDEAQGRMTLLRLRLNDVLVISVEALARQGLDVAIRGAFELGHALGNQHWAAVVSGVKVYVPLVLERRVMESVLRSHHFQHITYCFQPAKQIIPYLSPHEVRRLMGACRAEGFGHDHTCGHHSHHQDEYKK